MRYFIDLAYCGTAYHGWQKQPNALGVQAVLESALTTLLRQPTEVVGSGRTDTGVHACQQVAHFDGPDEAGQLRFIHRLNALLPNDIAIKSICPVQAQAHARFDATARAYQYRIVRVKDVFAQDLAYYWPHSVDIKVMNQAAKILLGEHDFQAFSRVKTEVNHFRCRVHQAAWRSDGDYLTFDIRADRFLRGMVRAIVGTLLLVGEQKIDSNAFQQIVASRDRKQAGRAVPPEGLFLTEVSYPDDIYLIPH